MKPVTGDRVVEADVAVIGAGPAGTLAATLLRRQGFSVVIVERSRFPRFVIGESLLPVCMEFMAEAGLLSAVQARGYQRKNGAIFRHLDTQAVFEFSEQFTAGWDHTFQVPRADFDDTLARGAAAAGVTLWFEHTVESLEFTEDGVRLAVVGVDGPRELRARFVLDASGPARVLARHLDLVTPPSLSPRVALFAHLPGQAAACTPQLEKVMVAIHPERPEVWYWGIPFADGRASVGVLAPVSIEDSSEQDPEGCYRRWLSEEPFLAPLAQAPTAFPVRRIAGYSSSVTRLYGDRFALLGNSGEFLDPIFSSGVALAFQSASLAAAATARQLRHWSGEQDEAPDWETGFAQPLREGLRTFGEFVRGWYDGTLPSILFHPQKSDGIKRMVCSILAGYAWDSDNPFATDTAGKLGMVHAFCTRSAAD